MQDTQDPTMGSQPAQPRWMTYQRNYGPAAAGQPDIAERLRLRREAANAPPPPAEPAMPAASQGMTQTEMALTGARDAISNSATDLEALKHVVRGGLALPVAVAADYLSPLTDLRPAAAPAAPVQPQPIASGTSTAGAGRGSVNPPLANAPLTPEMKAQGPTLGNSVGTAVDGADGVRKFLQNGRTLYSNVAGGDNDKLMSGNPGVMTVPAGAGGVAPITGRAVGGAGGQDQALYEARLAAINRGDVGAVQDSYAAQGESFGPAPITSRQQLTQQLAGRKLRRPGAELVLEAERNDINAANQATSAKSAGISDRLNQSRLKVEQQLETARAAVQSAKTPAEKVAAEDTLRALQGKYERDFPNRYTVVPGEQTVDPATGAVVRGASQILDNQTGEFVQPKGVKSAAAVQPPAQAISLLRANPALQARFDEKYGQGAAARALAQK